jgi:hypothetical protein
MSQRVEPNGTNIRSPAYLIGRTAATCAYCRGSTRLLALALPPSHETLHVDADGDGEELCVDVWQVASVNAFIFYVEHLPETVVSRLGHLSQFYRFAHSAAAMNSYWANHCEHCAALLDDHELHCEPDGAFMPTNEADASAIELLLIEEPLEAAAAGYAYEPEFFALMRRG